MLYRQLRLLRLKHHYSQESLARKLGIARSTYGSYERGERELSLLAARRLARLYGVSLESLLQ